MPPSGAQVEAMEQMLAADGFSEYFFLKRL